MDYSKWINFKTSDEAREEMWRAATFKNGDTVLVCRNPDFFYSFDSERRHEHQHGFETKVLAGGVFKIEGMSNHRGTWNGTWKYKIRTDRIKEHCSWRRNNVCYIDFGAISKPGRCSECKHRLTQLMGPGACPGYFEPVEEENQNT